MLIRRARRVSDYLGAECFAVAVHVPADLSEKDREAMEKHLSFARNMRIQTQILEGNDTAQVLVDFARRNQITQIFLVRPREKSWIPLWNGGLLQRIVRLAKDMQIIIVSQREPETGGRT
jgi:two-component system sensor histidine kinase KdpD